MICCRLLISTVFSHLLSCWRICFGRFCTRVCLIQLVMKKIMTIMNVIVMMMLMVMTTIIMIISGKVILIQIIPIICLVTIIVVMIVICHGDDEGNVDGCRKCNGDSFGEGCCDSDDDVDCKCDVDVDDDGEGDVTGCGRGDGYGFMMNEIFFFR